MAKKKDDNQAADIIVVPTGRVINCSLFIKQAYNDQATPKYTIEMAYPWDGEEHALLEDALLDYADDTWGSGASDDEDLVLPLKDGNKMKKKREKKGKTGDAYEDMVVIRAGTIYNGDGQDGPGGIQVYDEDVELLTIAQQGRVYPGCYGDVAVTIGNYTDDDGNNALMFYLSSFQKDRDGEKLVTAADRSTLFKPKTREKGEARKRRSR